MIIPKNLNQLKKAIAAGQPFKIIEHYFHPECTGQIRQPNVIQTNGFYSVEPGRPDSKVSTANGGKGYWMDYGKADHWLFDDEKATVYSAIDRPIMSISFAL